MTRRRAATFALALALWACGDESGPASEPDGDANGSADAAAPVDASAPDAAPPPPDALVPPDAGPALCPGPTTFRWDPLAASGLAAFPDDFYTVDDPDSPTGRRVRFDEVHAPWLAAVPSGTRNLYDDLSTLDGWGTLAATVIRFSGPVVLPDPEAIHLYDLAVDPPRRVPVEVRAVDDGATLLVFPLLPLRPKAGHGVLVTGLADPEGGCVGPGPALGGLLAGAPDPALARLAAAHSALRAAAGVAPDEVAAAVVFTTQSVSDMSAAIAERLAARPPVLAEDAACARDGALTQCELVLEAADFRRAGVIESPEPAATYRLPVSVWLPETGRRPMPLVLFAHGLGDQRGSGRYLAEALVRDGVAVAAVDAPGHGAHPTAPPPGDPLGPVRFFGYDFARGQIQARVMRDNFRQATYDKLQVLQRLVAQPDLDEDGTPDIDPERLGYWGLSLGGIMGAEVLALQDQVRVAVLTVPGGHLVSVVTDNQAFRQLRPVLERMAGGTADDLARVAPMVQTLLEPADPANYGPHVLHDRLPGRGARTPHVLQQMVMGDAVVPNPSNRALARALGLPHVPPVIEPVPLLVEAGPAPLSANLPDGVTTAGLFQLDRVTGSGGRVVRATHDNALSREGFGQARHFFETGLAEGAGAPEIIDPYAAFGTRPLP